MIRHFSAAVFGCFVISGCAHAQGGVPQIKCEVGTDNWCIATFDGTINMQDVGQARVWTLQARTLPSGQDMKIVETKACSSNSFEEAHLVKSEPDHASDTSQVYEYTLNSTGCSLQFEIPPGEASSTYKQVMKFGILVGPAKQAQLYGAKE